MMRAVVGMLVVVVALVGFSACGGDEASDEGMPANTAVSGDPLSSEEYFQRFDALLDGYTNRQRSTSEELTEAFSAAFELESMKQALVGFLEESSGNVQGYLQELATLLPPSQVQGLHDEYLDLFTEGAGVFESYIDRTVGVQSEAEFNEVAKEFSQELEDAGKKIDEVCLALQASADGKGIEVKLACGGGEPD